MKRVLIMDSDKAALAAVTSALSDRYRIRTADSARAALAALTREDLEAVICCRRGLDLLRAAAHLRPAAARILASEPEQVPTLRAVLDGVRIHRLVGRPLSAPELEIALQGAFVELRLEAENHDLAEDLARARHQLDQALRVVKVQEHQLDREVDIRTQELREILRHLTQLALRDGLTGLYNHRYFQEELSNHLALAARHRIPVGLLFLDVDYFKNYNDVLGHTAGDTVLKRLGTLLSGAATRPDGSPVERGRASDIAARYGGEEFVLVLPGTDRAGSLVRAERLRQLVDEHPFPDRHVQPGGRLTVSIGVAAFPEDATDKRGLVDAADQALMQAKRRGRNTVCAAGAELSSPPWQDEAPAAS